MAATVTIAGPRASLCATLRNVLRIGSVVLLLSAMSLGYAPFQCGEADPAKALEETPGEALYQLAGEFKARGEEAAWEGTLRFLLERYPSSRFAVMGAYDLEKAGLDAGVRPVGDVPAEPASATPDVADQPGEAPPPT